MPSEKIADSVGMLPVETRATSNGRRMAS